MHFELCMLIVLSAFVGAALGIDQQEPLTSNDLPSRGIPLLGFGTWNLNISPQNTTDAVSLAIQSGYRHIDGAAAYGNEKDVGRGIKEGLYSSNLTRNDIWVTSKLWNDHHDPDKVETALNQTLLDLGLEYLDLYLMHWPVGNDPKTGKLGYDYVTTWQAMVKLLSTGRVRNIGVANFSPHQIHELIRKSYVKPAVHQMELHPYLQQAEWVDFHQKHGIHVTAYSPLGNMNPIYRKSSKRDKSAHPPLLLENKVMKKIADERGCTPAQVALAWGISRETSVIPKSSHPEYIRENSGSLECRLHKKDNGKIKKLGRKFLKRFNNPSERWGVDLFEGLDDA